LLPGLCLVHERVDESAEGRGDPPGIVLPASIYPPHWDPRKTVVHAIQVAAKDQADMMLPVDSSKEGDTHMHLRCYRGIVNTKTWKNTPDKPEVDACGVHDPAYKTDVKMDTFVNKSQYPRGTEKNEGLCPR